MVGVQPVSDDPCPNDLITMAPYQVHAANRIKYPMVRKSWLEGGAEHGRPELRGCDEWVRVSWDQALTLVSGQIARLQKQYGPQSIHAGSYGWKSVGMLHNSRTLLQRLMNLSGASSATPVTTPPARPGNHDPCGRLHGGLRTADRLAQRHRAQ